MKRIRFSPAARDDLTSIARYLLTVSPAGSRKVTRRIREVIAELRDHPRIGRFTNDARIRQINARPFPYIIFYQEIETAVLILRIRHGARNPDEFPGAE